MMESEKMLSLNNTDREKEKKLITTAFMYLLGNHLTIIINCLLTMIIGIGFVYLIYIAFLSIGLFPVISYIIPVLILGTILGIVTLIHSVIKSILPKTIFAPGIKIEETNSPELFRIVKELCSILKCKMPNSIILHAETSIYVSHEKIKLINGNVKGSCIFIGMPFLSFLSQKEVRSLIAHELAFFSEFDTKFRSLTYPVYNSIQSLLFEMGVIKEQNNKNGLFFIPLLLSNKILKRYLRSFYKFYINVMNDRQKRADSIAAEICGTGSYSDALQKVSFMSKIFTSNFKKEFSSLASEGKMYKNIYQYIRERLPLFLETENHLKFGEGETASKSESDVQIRIGNLPQAEEKYFENDLSIGLLATTENYEKSLTSGYAQYLMRQLAKTRL